jgi:LPS-assembly protein
MTLAQAKSPGHAKTHPPQPKHPANEWALCRGDAVPAFPGQPPTGSKDARPTTPADIQSDKADLSKASTSVFEGNVELRRADQWMFADRVTYQHEQDTWQAIGSVKYQDSSVRLTADRGDGDLDKDISTVDAVQYQLRNVRGNGKAAHARVEGDQETYTDATYSTCDPNDRKWEIRGKRIDIDREKGEGKAHDATVRIGNVPVFYLPYFTFPLDNERKTGFLMPGFGQSSNGGFELTLPYYLNLAPNYDATLTAHYYGSRGLMADTEFRYLTEHGHGTVEATWLPDDSQRHYDRGSVFAKSLTNLTPNWYVNADLNYVSDTHYFEDFSRQTFGSAIGLLSSTVGVYGRGRYWSAGAYVQDWEITDTSLADSSAPFRRLPDVYFRWQQPVADHIEVGLKSEAVKFTQLVLDGGSRVDLYPYIVLPFEHAAWYVKPELGYRYTAYNLDAPVVPGGNTSPTRGVPIFDIDAGAYFDRDTTLFGHSFVNTLEPRLYYLRVPYRDQSDLPIFDTQQFTFGYAQLFRTNSFTGADRQADANQLTAAVTTRLLDNADGREWLTASFGQIRYFDPPRVQLPGVPFVDRSASDYVVDTDLNLDDHWTIGGSYQYDPHLNRTDLGSLRGQYRFGQGGVINAAYRYRPGQLEQTDMSFVYPLNANWRLLGRWDYSLKDSTTLEALGGLEWQDCCMAVRVIGRDYIRNQLGQKNFAMFIEVELKGLGSLGRNSSDLLDRDILGYTR